MVFAFNQLVSREPAVLLNVSSLRKTDIMEVKTIAALPGDKNEVLAEKNEESRTVRSS